MKALIVLMATVVVACPGLTLAGEAESKGASASEATTVKSSKSNTSDRVDAASDKKGEGGGADKATTVKGSKSNTSE
jgi:hypothetical protein